MSEMTNLNFSVEGKSAREIAEYFNYDVLLVEDAIIFGCKTYQDVYDFCEREWAKTKERVEKSEQKRIEALGVREWWIEPDAEFQHDSDPYFGAALTHHPRQGPLAWQYSLIHVVEAKALQRAEAEVERLREALGQVANFKFNAHTSYIMDFNAVKRIAREALGGKE